jgi:CO/xanthine dehydrogenase FAD-binding subunit
MSEPSVYQPKDLSDALSWLSTAPTGARCLAGGTDLMVLQHVQAPLPAQFMDIWGLQELRGVSEEEEALWLGALTTYTEMIQHPLIVRYLPLLSEAAQSVGAAAIQNRGTLGGNIANASPAGDTLPILLAHEAEVELTSRRGVRLVAATQFYQGYKKLDMRPDEIVSRVRIPKRHIAEKSLWLKVGQRKAQAISKVMIGARALVQNGTIAWAKVSLGSVAATPVRLSGVEGLLTGKKVSEELAVAAGEAARSEVFPISDVRSTEGYRRAVSGNIVARFVRTLL